MRTSTHHCCPHLHLNGARRCHHLHRDRCHKLGSPLPTSVPALGKVAGGTRGGASVAAALARLWSARHCRPLGKRRAHNVRCRSQAGGRAPLVCRTPGASRARPGAAPTRRHRRVARSGREGPMARLCAQWACGLVRRRLSGRRRWTWRKTFRAVRPRAGPSRRLLQRHVPSAPECLWLPSAVVSVHIGTHTRTGLTLAYIHPHGDLT